MITVTHSPEHVVTCHGCFHRRPTHEEPLYEVVLPGTRITLCSSCLALLAQAMDGPTTAGPFAVNEVASTRCLTCGARGLEYQLQIDIQPPVGYRRRLVMCNDCADELLRAIYQEGAMS